MKNNFITKIIGATLAIAMMIGGAVGINAAKEAIEVDALNASVSMDSFGWDDSTQNAKGENNAATIDANVKFYTTGSTNNGKYYSDWRLYNTGNGNVIVKAYNGYLLTSVTYTFTTSNSGCLSNANGSSKTALVTSGTPVALNNVESVEYKVANTNNKTNGQVRITEIAVTYAASSSDPSVTIDGSSFLINNGGSKKFTGTIANNDNYTITWSASDQHVSIEPATSSSGEQVDISFEGVATGTTPIQIVATLNDEASTSSTKNVYALEHAGTEADPFSATDAQVFSHTNYAAQSGGDWYVQGYVVGAYQTNKGYYIDEISTNTTSKKFEVYNSNGVVNSTGREIIIGKSYIVAHGAMTYFVNYSQCELTDSIITSVDNGAIPGVMIDGEDRVVNINDSITLTATTENPDDAVVTWSSSNHSVATIDSSTGAVTLIAVGKTNITATITVDATNYTDTIVLTVIQNALEDGDSFVIKGKHGDDYYYLTGIHESNYGTTSKNKNEAIVFTAIDGATANTFKFKYGSNYLNFVSGNTLTATTDASADTILWTASDDGTGTVVTNVKVNTRKLQFNYNNGNPRFACYESSMTAVEIEKVVAPVITNIDVAGDSNADANDALSITKEFLYEVEYEDPSNQGTSAVSVSVLNSNDTTDGASVSAAPSNGTFSVTFTANDTYTVTVTSEEDLTKSASTTITVYNIHVAVLTDFNLYTDDSLVEGDYLITYNNYAMAASVNSSWVQYETVTPNNNVVSTEDNSIVWSVIKNGEYYNIYNALENKYLASTGTKNQAQLLANGTDDKALWSYTTANNKFEFINKNNSSKGINANLRENGTYGFACYSTSTGGALTLYKKNAKSSTEELTTNTELSYRYTKDGNNYTFSDVSMRFGGLISKDLWAELDTGNHLIEGFGVMFTSTNVVHEPDSIKSKAGEAVVASANNDYANTLVDFYMPKASMATPAEDGDDYYWNLFFSVDFDEISINKYYVAAAYIKVDGEYVFMKEVKYSVTSLAQDYLDYRNCDGTTAEGSLAKLASLSPAE